MTSIQSHNSSSSGHSDSFVMIPKSNSFLSQESGGMKDSLVSQDGDVALPVYSPSNYTSEGLKEDELLDKVNALDRDNNELKDTLKRNNLNLKQYIISFAEMQESHRRNNENVKKEHQKAKEVVKKLRDENRALKVELKKAIQEQNSGHADEGKAECLEKENLYLRSQISTMEENKLKLDKMLKEFPFPENASGSLQLLLGSLASHDFFSECPFGSADKPVSDDGLSHPGRESEGQRYSTASMEDRYNKLETEKEILKVDLDKITVEKLHTDQRLAELLRDHQKLKESYGHLNVEKDELCRMATGQKQKESKEQNGKLEMEARMILLQGELNKTKQDLENEKDELCRMEREQKQKEFKEQNETQETEARMRLLQGELNKTRQDLEDEKEKLRRMVMEQNQKELKEQNEKQKKEERMRLVQDELKRINQYLEDEKQKCVKLTEENEAFKTEIYELKVALQEQMKMDQAQNVKEADDDDGDVDDGVSREKYDTIKKLYLKYESQAEDYEQRMNQLESRRIDFGNEKKRAAQKLEETKHQMEAELESRSEAYRVNREQLHSELKEGREREESYQEQVCHLIQDNERLETKNQKLTELNSRRDSLYEEKMKDTERKKIAKFHESEHLVEMLKSQLGGAREEIKKQQEQTDMYRSEHERLSTQYSMLSKENDELMNSFNETLMKQGQSSADIERYKGKVDDMSAQLACAEEACHKKDIRIEKLDEIVRDAQSHRDAVPILKQQLDVYCNDFQAEREARERQQTELLQEREENEELKLAIEELQHQLTQRQMLEMQRRHSNHIPAPVPVGGSAGYNPDAFRSGFLRRGGEPGPVFQTGRESGAPGEVEESEEPYPCPGCRRTFNRFSDIENHVLECQAAIHGNGPPQPGGNNSLPDCPKCGNAFPDLDTLRIHLDTCLDS